MKDINTPNLTSLATLVRPLTTILQNISQISRSNVTGTAEHEYTKTERAQYRLHLLLIMWF